MAQIVCIAVLWRRCCAARATKVMPDKIDLLKKPASPVPSVANWAPTTPPKNLPWNCWRRLCRLVNMKTGCFWQPVFYNMCHFAVAKNFLTFSNKCDRISLPDQIPQDIDVRTMVETLYLVKLMFLVTNSHWFWTKTVIEYSMKDSRQKKQRNGWHHHAETCVCVKNQAGTVVSIAYTRV